jgi:hypothetical protein
MKKELVVVFTIVYLLSCKKSEFEYSCSPVINEFVIEHLKELSVLTVHELASYDFQLQRAIFNSWDYQKKRNVWIEKLNYVLIHIPFTETENAHIQTLITHINEDYFLKENIEKNLEIRSLFAAEWINYSINDLGWSNQFIAFIVYRLYTDQSQFNNELSMLRSISATIKTDSEPGDCDCNISVDFCGNSFCSSSGCTTISTGCGWLWSMSCDGNCPLRW